MITNTLYRNTPDRIGCPLRSEFGKCTAYGGYCATVRIEICEALHKAYAKGRFERTDDMMPVRRGHWALCAHGVIRCTECGIDSKRRTPFCHNCGALMDAGDKEPTFIETENPFFESLKTGLMQAISGETREMAVSDVPNIDDGHITQGVEE